MAQSSTIVERQVLEKKHLKQDCRVVKCSRLFTNNAAAVWDSVSQAQNISSWFQSVSGNLVKGGSFEIEGNASGKILKCAAQKSYELTWEFGGGVSWVSVSLESEDKGQKTKFTLEHISAKDEESEEFWNEYGPGATGVGWDLALHGLSDYLQGGCEPLDKEKYGLWMSSDSGKQFMLESSQAWGKAALEAKNPPSAADVESMVQSTSDFYTSDE